MPSGCLRTGAVAASGFATDRAIQRQRRPRALRRRDRSRRRQPGCPRRWPAVLSVGTESGRVAGRVRCGAVAYGLGPRVRARMGRRTRRGSRSVRKVDARGLRNDDLASVLGEVLARGGGSGVGSMRLVARLPGAAGQTSAERVPLHGRLGSVIWRSGSRTPAVMPVARSPLANVVPPWARQTSISMRSGTPVARAAGSRPTPVAPGDRALGGFDRFAVESSRRR